jgi:hypothetical protein
MANMFEWTSSFNCDFDVSADGKIKAPASDRKGGAVMVNSLSAGIEDILDPEKQRSNIGISQNIDFKMASVGAEFNLKPASEALPASASLDVNGSVKRGLGPVVEAQVSAKAGIDVEQDKLALNAGAGVGANVFDGSLSANADLNARLGSKGGSLEGGEVTGGLKLFVKYLGSCKVDFGVIYDPWQAGPMPVFADNPTFAEDMKNWVPDRVNQFMHRDLPDMQEKLKVALEEQKMANDEKIYSPAKGMDLTIAEKDISPFSPQLDALAAQAFADALNKNGPAGLKELADLDPDDRLKTAEDVYTAQPLEREALRDQFIDGFEGKVIATIDKSVAATAENAPTGDDIAANVNAAVKAELDSSPDAPKPDGSSWLYRRRNRRRTLPHHTQILQAERHLQWPAWFRPYHNVKTRLHPCQTAP